MIIRESFPCNHLKKGLDCDNVNPVICETCGFNPKEEKLRKAYIRAFGLIRNRNGNMQLKITAGRRKIIQNDPTYTRTDPMDQRVVRWSSGLSFR